MMPASKSTPPPPHGPTGFTSEHRPPGGPTLPEHRIHTLDGAALTRIKPDRPLPPSASPQEASERDRKREKVSTVKTPAQIREALCMASRRLRPLSPPLLPPPQESDTAPVMIDAHYPPRQAYRQSPGLNPLTWLAGWIRRVGAWLMG